MPVVSQSSRRQIKAVAAIISRNVFLLINGIILMVVVLLSVFGDVQEGIFLGLVTLLNVVIGSAQEISAWLTLEKLQLLAVPRVVKINDDDSESIVLAEDLKKDDRIKLAMGDQAPSDGVLATSHGFEVSEALITGESAAFLKKPGDQVLAGSIVTSGSGILKIEKAFAESRIALMTKSIKKYAFVLSPLQISINTVIRYAGYALMLIILFVVGRGLLISESTVTIIQGIGALANVLLPQGLVVVVTLLFSYGAAHLYKRNVLLQEVNATEKIGRIENLCVDKTGTLTDSNLVFERKYVAPGIGEQYADDSTAAYITGTNDSSRTIGTIKKLFPDAYRGDIVGDVAFSSSRQFGAVHIKDEQGERVILAGAPDVFLPRFSSEEDRAWVQRYIDTEAKSGKRIVCFARSEQNTLPDNLSEVRLSALSLFVLTNNLREGVVEAVNFFQERGVRIRVISGDNPSTVQAVATTAGISGTYAVITGAELEQLPDTDFREKVNAHTIFARIKPEQKEKIIEALKESGFTAMIGDGANDALAIKKADLGIAMFDGAPATRQLASVVLVKNSFTDLPNGVKLADSVIQNIEICAAIFFNEVFLGFFFFAILTVFGFSFPFTPLNITFLNYFTLGLPTVLIFYWVVQSARTRVVRHDRSFLRRVLPFALASALPQSVVTAFAFYSGLEPYESSGLTGILILSFVIAGVVFFLSTPSVYGRSVTKTQLKQLSLLVLTELVSLIVLFKIPIVADFYRLTVPSLHSIFELSAFIVPYVLIQYALSRWASRFKFLNISPAEPGY